MKNIKTTQKRWFVIAIGFVLMAIIFVYFYAFSPFQNDSFFPYCVFNATTGLDCVGCGGQRAVHELLHFNFLSALDHNALFVLSIPLLLYYIFYSLRRYLYGVASPNSFWYSRTFGILFITLVLLFLILRNINVYPFNWLNSIS